MLPLVSVIIPTYNAEQYIAVAVESVLGQSYRQFELIVIDDGCTDRTAEKLAAYKEARVIRQGNAGPSAARNHGIRIAKGKYCAFLDSDDIMMPERLKLQVHKMEEHSEAGLVYTDLMTFDENGIVHKSKKEFIKPHSGKVLGKLLRENFITASTVMVRRDCFKKAGYFDESMNHSEDYKMWLNIAKYYSIEYVDLPLVKYRYHEGSLSRNRIVINTSSYNVVKTFWEENNEYKQKHRLVHKLSIANQLKNLGNAYYSYGDTRGSFRFLAEAIKLNPFSKTAYKLILKAILRQLQHSLQACRS